MMAPRHGRHGSSRLLGVRMALYFLGAGVWIGGALTDRPLATGSAIVILLVAFLLGRFGASTEEP